MTSPGAHTPFPAAYQLSIEDVVPPDAFVFVATPAGTTEVLSFEVVTADDVWWGVVRAGRPPVAGAISGLWTTPSPGHACVVGRGDAFMVPVADPGHHATIDTAGPVIQVRAATNEGLLLLASPWEITAVGERGVQWHSGRLAIDGLRMDEILDGRLAGVADPKDVEPRDFVVDLATGRHEGGATVG